MPVNRKKKINNKSFNEFLRSENCVCHIVIAFKMCVLYIRANDLIFFIIIFFFSFHLSLVALSIFMWSIWIYAYVLSSKNIQIQLLNYYIDLLITNNTGFSACRPILSTHTIVVCIWLGHEHTRSQNTKTAVLINNKQINL